jgi:hypothetical protein
LRTEIFRKYSPKTLVVLEGVIPLEIFSLVEWKYSPKTLVVLEVVIPLEIFSLVEWH